jgi:hypothetical protein
MEQSMKKVYFIARADDAGSSHSANVAIACAVKAGFIKNVSLMAPGGHISEAADLLAENNRVCFGMHGTLNAEWDKVKWRPVVDIGANSPLTDVNGFFIDQPRKFAQTKPPVELVMREYAAQLDKLTRLGFNISYIDSHMFPEGHIAGMDAAVADFAKTKGLIDHMYYYELPPGLIEAANSGGNLLKALKNIPSGQYFYVAHPAVYSQEMLLTGNSEYTGEQVAKGRAGEAKLLGTTGLPIFMRLLGIRALRYDEAAPLAKRLTEYDIRKAFGSN